LTWNHGLTTALAEAGFDEAECTAYNSRVGAQPYIYKSLFISGSKSNNSQHKA